MQYRLEIRRFNAKVKLKTLVKILKIICFEIELFQFLLNFARVMKFRQLLRLCKCQKFRSGVDHRTKIIALYH